MALPIAPIPSQPNVNPVTPVNGFVKGLTDPFKDILAQAVKSQEEVLNKNSIPAQANFALQKPKFQNDLLAQITPDQMEELERRKLQDQQSGASTESKGEVPQINKRYDSTPFQLFLDKSVDALENLSTMEMRSNDLIEEYIQGKVSIDEVTIEVAKLNVAISFVTSVVTSATQTFKEIQQMAI